MTTMKSVAMATVSAWALTLAAPVATAQTPHESEDLQQFEFNIPAQPLPDALMSLSEQSKQTVLASPQLTQGRRSDAVSGTYTMPQALARILKSSGLKYKQRDARTWLVTAQLAEMMDVTSNDETVGISSAEQRPIRVAQISEQDEGEPSAEEEEEKRARDEIIVTGTNIRGIAPESSPTRTFTREDIQISGAATAQDFIQTLPANFGGGSNADAPLGLPNDVNSVFNGGSVGPIGSSVNLRGLGSGSTLVLLNGHRLAPSSGIGDFVDISLIPASVIERVEVLTDGASSIYGGDAVAGVVNFVLRDDFDGAEASFRYGAVTEGNLDEYRASVTGGKNWNTGNALVAYEYFKQDNLSVEDRVFSQGASLPNDLLPSQERHSVLATASQELTEELEVFADFTFSQRESARDSTSLIRFSRFAPSSTNRNISAGGSWKVSESWFVDFAGTYSDVHSEIEQSGDITLRRELDSDIWTADAKASGTALRLPGGDIKLAVGGHYREEGFANFGATTGPADRRADRNVYALFGEAFIPIFGSGNAVRGAERLELNVSGRFEDYSDFGSTANPKVGVLWSPFDALNLRGSYSTSFNPPPLGRVGASDLIGAVFRTSFFNSILGLTPGDPSIADVVELFVQGTFKDLDAENSRAFTAGADFSKQWGRHDVLFKATYFDIEFENRLGTTPIPGSRSEFDAPNIAFNNPELFPEGIIIFSPSQSEISEVLDSLDSISAPFGDDPFAAEIINSVSVVQNLARTLVTGFDFEIAYRYDSDIGTVSLGIDGTYLYDFQQQGADTTPLVAQVDTLYNPVDLKLRGRVAYAYDGFAANVFVNYTDDYRVDNTAGAMRIDSWTTVDLSLSYDTQEKLENLFLDNTVLRISVLNLFDDDPPSAPSNPTFGIFGFDPTNASPLGRFIAFELTKRF